MNRLLYVLKRVSWLLSALLAGATLGLVAIAIFIHFGIKWMITFLVSMVVVEFSTGAWREYPSTPEAAKDDEEAQ